MKSKYKIEDVINQIGHLLNQKELNFDVYSVINKCLYLCLNLPNINLVSMFLLNEDTFEFEHRITLPKEQKSLSLEIFHYILENGIVGEAIEVGNYKEFELKNQSEKSLSNSNLPDYFLLFPLITTNKIIGLLLIKIADDPEIIQKQDIIVLLKLISRYFALLIENILLQTTLEKTNDIIEQESALKSVDIKRNLIEIESILNALQVGVFVVDPETDEIQLSNFSSAKITGYKQSELIGKKVTELFITEQFSNSGSTKSELFIPGTKSFESSIINSAGIQIPVIRSVTFTNIRTKKFRIDSFFDISFKKGKDEQVQREMKELENKYKERTEDLLVIVSKLKEEIKEKEKAQKEIQTMLNNEKEVNVMKSNFITMVSHEFRSPLTRIKSAAQMIEKFSDKLNENEKAEYIKRIISTVDQISSLLDNVSLIGGTDLKDLIFEPKDIDVLLLLKQFISGLNINYGKSDKIVLSTDCERIVAQIDEKLIKIICFNALTNLIKYTEENYQINLFVSYTDKELVLIVNDIKLILSKQELEVIKNVIKDNRIIEAMPPSSINWSVVAKSVQIHKGSINLIEKENDIFSIIIEIPIIVSK